ncbi:LemA protein [Panacagrimonas perspica]|uniref:LemA protein n=1 Tax=Panacagrimonas perspica TaxID=381431 RepID=A0A4S3K3P7_9GAMM|nr:LemA family protein [Panacagrimonas perspica]TDU31330.1 LemA protein [Panacagrimonas perspica]THD02670.1 hypothetical protein B1810_14115 [Panacagrimonas perspica]
MGWLVTAVVVAAAGLGVWLFNRLVSDRNQVGASWSDVDVQLQRRHDLIPNLVEIVKGYAGHERTVLERVVAERNAMHEAQRITDKGAHEPALKKSLSGLVALAEAYPDLKASTHFMQLSAQLAEVENNLQYARRFYNGSVRQYNTRRDQFPDLLVARLFSFQQGEFFAAEADSRSAPGVMR